MAGMVNDMLRYVVAGFLAGATPAVAADYKIIEAPEIGPSEAGFSWTGFYFGGSLGAAHLEDDDPAFPILPGVTIPLHSEGDHDTWGVHAGYMYQYGNWVIGGEYEYAKLDVQFIGDGIGPLPIFVEDSHALRARLGAALDRVQPYGLAGATYATTNIGLEDWTWTVGGGIDVAVTANILVGFQYNYNWYDEFDGSPIQGHENYVTARISYKF